MATSYPKSLQGAMDQMMNQNDTSSCPAPTQDITLNLKNRAKAITTAKYGPENPNLPNEADPWGVVKLADLGYCEIFDFKCSAQRSCRAWVVGGPNTGEAKDEDEDMGEGEMEGEK